MFPVAVDEPERLLDLHQYHIVGTGTEERFDRIVQLAASLFSVPLAAITFVDSTRVWIKAKVGLDACEMPRSIGFCAHTIAHDQLLVVPDLAADARFADNPLLQGERGIRFYAGAPLTTATGHRIGALCLMDHQPREALCHEQEVQFASLASLVIDHLEVRRSEFVNAVARGFADATQDALLCVDARGVMTFANRAALDLFGYEPHDMMGRTLDVIMPERFRRAHTGGVARIAEGRPSKLAGKSVELIALRRSGEEFPVEISICSWRDDHGQHMGASLRDVSERKQRDLRLHRLAHHDPLTGLPNRLQFESAVNEACSAARATSVLLLDLGNLKALNDSLGHCAGDALLQILAVRWQAALDDTAVLARLGGDQFAVALPGSGDPLCLRACADAILSTVDAPVQLSGRNVQINLSIGAAIAPHHGRDAEELIASADLALGQTRDDDGRRFALYQPSMRMALAARRALKDELIRAFENNEFVVHYQPQVRLDTGTLIGAEALLRWQHPRRGLLLPGAFMAVLEEHMVALDVGTWVLDQACRQLAAWRAGGRTIARVGVNLFSAQLCGDALVATVKATLDRNGLGAGDLELEITEKIALQNDERTLDPLHTLQALGVRLAFDDFGTGYASLSTLKRVPLATLKIDRSFVRDIVEDRHDAAVVAAVLDLGRRLGLDVVAEGVETAEQEVALLAMHCPTGQGYRYGKGMPADEFARSHWGRASARQRRRA